MLTSPSAKSVDYEHELLNENDGIASSIIFSIVQDNHGFLWLGTGYNGVLRYDGKSVVNYLHDEANSDSLPHNNAGNLFLDNNGKLWIGSWGGGLLSYDLQADKFQQYSHSPSDPSSVSSNNVQSIFQDNANRYWIGTYAGGLNQLDANLESFKRHPVSVDNQSGSSSRRIWDIEQSNDDTLWLATDSGVNKLDINTSTFTHYFPSEQTQITEHDRVRRVLAANEEVIFLGTQNGVLRFDSAKKTYQSIHTPEIADIGPIYSIIKTSFDEYWVTSNYGVFSFNEDSVALKKVPLNFDDKCSQTIFEDRQGIIWLSCEGVGLYKITRKSVFNTIPEPGLNSAYALNNALNGDILIGTSQSGILRWDPEARRLSSVFEFPAEQTTISVNFIVQSPQGDIWFADNQSVFRLKPNGQRQEVQALSEVSQSFADIRDIETDELGNLWLVTSEGLYVVDNITNELTYYSVSEISNQNVKKTSSSRLYFGPDEKMWISFGDTIFRSSSALRAFEPLGNSVQGLLSNSVSNLIFSMYIDKNQQLWFGNMLGLYKLDLSSGKRSLVSSFFNERDNQGIRYISQDQAGFLWFVTAVGISRFDPESQETRHFDKRDGLPGSRYFYNPTTGLNDKHIYLSSRDGIFHFDPLAIIEPIANEKTILTNFEVLGSSIRFNLADIIKNGISLDYDQSNIRFEFATLDLLNAQQIQYSYMLEGFDEDWIENGNDSTATYTNLNGGTYTFRVKSKTKQNLWYENELQINLTVATPIWKQNWMFGVYFCIVILGVALYLHRQKQAVIELERQVAEKTADIALESKKLASANRIKSQFLANMSHEIRTPLTTVIGQAEAIICRDIEPDNIYKEVEIIHDSGVYLLALLNDILDVTKIEENKFELEYSPQDIHMLLENINTMFSMQAKVKGLTFSLHENLPRPFVINADGLRLKQILINLLSNAIKFTLQGGVSLHVDYDRAQLKFSVKDTGIGINKAQVEQIFKSFTQGDSSIRRRFGGSGLGLHLSNQLAKLMQGNIDVSSELEKGSTFTFTMPVPDISTDASAVQGTLSFDTLCAEPLFNGNILLAEDHSDNRRLISRLLTKLGLTVYTAKDGFEAINMYEIHKPEVVLMDIQMPNMDGIQAFKELRAVGCETPIIALTANAMQNEVEAYFELGFDGYIQKPIDRHLLITTIATFYNSADQESMNRASSILGNVDMSDLVVQFQESLCKDLEAIQKSVSEADIESIRAKVHKLSGAAQLFGFKELGNYAITVEQKIKAGAASIQEIESELALLLHEIKKSLP